MTNPVDTTGDRLRRAWIEIIEAEAARGAAANATDARTAQQAYQQALERFRMAQIEAFTVALGNVALIQELIETHDARIIAHDARLTAHEGRLMAHEARLAALERAVAGLRGDSG